MRRLSIFFLLALAACSQQPWHSEWDAVTQQPDAKVTTGSDASGDDTRDIHLASGVDIHEVRHGDKVESTAVDNSGHGAVMCALGIYTQLKSALEVCSSGKDKKLKQNVDQALNRINDFIVANSITPVREPDLEAQVRQAVITAKKDAAKLSKTGRTKQCQTSDVAKILDQLRAQSLEKLEDNVDQLLSVPRPPVINPCL